MAEYRGQSIFNIIMNTPLIPDGDHTFICGDQTYPVEFKNFFGNQDWATNAALGLSVPTLGNTTASQRMLIVKVDGDLNIQANTTVTPQVKKRGFTLFVTGTLTCHGNINMNAKGADTTGNANQPVYIFQNKDDIMEYIFSGGANGGAAVGTNVAGIAGANGTYRGTGGGGSGSGGGSTSSNYGNGGAGSSSGGPGGAGGSTANNSGSGLGGAGGRGTSYAGGSGGGGGSISSGSGYVGATGAGNAGGLLIIFATKLLLSNTSIISSNGTNGNNGTGSMNYGGPGGGSGGGSINIFYEELLLNQGTKTANGGTGGQPIAGTGTAKAAGKGGNGTITLTQIESHVISDIRYPRIHYSGPSLLQAITENIRQVKTGNSYISFPNSAGKQLTYFTETVVFRGNQTWDENTRLGIPGIKMDNENNYAVMLVVVVKGNLTIKSGVKIDNLVNPRGGIVLIVLGTLENYGEIAFNAKGQLKNEEIGIFKNNNETYEVCPASGRNGVILIYATRVKNRGILRLNGDYINMFYQGQIEIGTLGGGYYLNAAGAKSSLWINRITTDDKVIKESVNSFL